MNDRVSTHPQVLRTAASLMFRQEYTISGTPMFEHLEKWSFRVLNNVNERFLVYLIKFSHFVGSTPNMIKLHTYLPGSPVQAAVTQVADSKAAEQGAYLGKLGFKEEAAGKVRVFAMVDA